MGEKVLVVDDDPYIIISLREILEDEGFEVLAADSGKECLKILENGFKGVILIDIMMPQMDGWETIDKIVKKGLLKENIISVLSARDIPKERPNVIKYIEDYLEKPVEPNELLKTVNNYFQEIE